MTALTISGTVESIELVRDSERHTVRYGVVETPVVVKATVVADDGTRAFVSTQVGHITDRGIGVFFHRSSTEEAAAWPFSISERPVVHTSNTPEVFPDAFCIETRERLVIWSGDRVAIRGSVQERTSRVGSRYLSVSRAKVVSVERPEWAAIS